MGRLGRGNARVGSRRSLDSKCKRATAVVDGYWTLVTSSQRACDLLSLDFRSSGHEGSGREASIGYSLRCDFSGCVAVISC